MSPFCRLGSFPWDCDNNTIAAINPSNLAMWGSTALDFTSWQVASGQDVNSNSGTVQVDAIGIPLTMFYNTRILAFSISVSST